VGHELFVKYSVYSKYLMRLIAEGGNEPVLMRQMAKVLTLIELQCDAFAALTLDSLGYNPLELIKDIEETTREYPDYKSDYHPPDTQRRSVVEGILSPKALATEPRQSEAFVRLKQLLADLKPQDRKDHPASDAKHLAFF
jgi:hypothetical protein